MRNGEMVGKEFLTVGHTSFVLYLKGWISLQQSVAEVTDSDCSIRVFCNY